MLARPLFLAVFTHASGHCGIVVGAEQTASGDSTVPGAPGEITISNFGFRSLAEINSIHQYGWKARAVVRRFTSETGYTY